MRVLSFDCANKSLGHCLFDIDTELLSKKYLPIGKPNVEKIHAMVRANITGMNGVINVITCGVNSLFSEKISDTNIMYRTKKLHSMLCSLDLGNRGDIDAVVIEYQYVAGSHSREVSDCLCMYFAEFNVDLFFPSSRKKLHFTDTLNYSHFKEKYAKSYTANKAHSVANFKYIIEELELESLQQCIAAIHSSNHDDIADSFLNAWMWVVKAIICPQMLPLHVERTKAEKEAKAALLRDARAEKAAKRVAMRATVKASTQKNAIKTPPA